MCQFLKIRYRNFMIISLLTCQIIGIFTNIFYPTNSLRNDKITISSNTFISYGRYYSSFNDAYIYNVIEWSFNTNNESDITVVCMDYLNYLKFDVNDSTSEYERLSVGRKKDSGTIHIPYEDTWVLLFLNFDPNFPITGISVEVEVILDPLYYFIIPLILNMAIIAFFISISIYYKKQSRKNKNSNYICGYFIFLIIYFYFCWFILPYFNYIR